MKCFEPTGPTQSVAIDATVGGQSITLPAKLSDKDGMIRVEVIGTVTVFITLDGTTPTTAIGMPLRPDQPEGLGMPTGKLVIKGIASGAGSTLYVTPGRGTN
jgi:hypothetical protein